LKLFINCKSLLLQKALENFLNEFEIGKDGYDLLICDNEKLVLDKSIFVIAKNGDLSVPFSKEELVNRLENFKILTLEDELTMILDNFKKDILKVVKKYEK